jgi:hypothetical protein
MPYHIQDFSISGKIFLKLHPGTLGAEYLEA